MSCGSIDLSSTAATALLTVVWSRVDDPTIIRLFTGDLFILFVAKRVRSPIYCQAGPYRFVHLDIAWRAAKCAPQLHCQDRVQQRSASVLGRCIDVGTAGDVRNHGTQVLVLDNVERRVF